MLVLGVVALIAATIAMVIAEKPPIDTYDRALKALSRARKVEAEVYAKTSSRAPSPAWRKPTSRGRSRT